jgi:hypothetical protein
VCVLTVCVRTVLTRAHSNGCYLNLFGLVEDHLELTDPGGYGRFYSVASAVGLIFGTGNTGRYLNRTGDVHTYFSRDAGVTWEQVCTWRCVCECLF